MKKWDRVKVSPDHYGTGLQGRLGRVHRVLEKYIEVDLDEWGGTKKSPGLAGCGIVAFKPEDLIPSKAPYVKKNKSWMIGRGLLDDLFV